MNTWREMFDHYSETGEYKMREAVALICEAADKGDSHATHIIHVANLYPELANALEMAIGFCEGRTVTTWRELGPILKAVLAKCKE